MPKTMQTFHVTGIDPLTALCGASGNIWADRSWPSGEDMRSGMFRRCRTCDRLLTPALKTALDEARDLELAAIDAYKVGWREGGGLPTGQTGPAPTVTSSLVRECREIGRRVGAEAARLVREARDSGDPPSATLAGATTPAP